MKALDFDGVTSGIFEEEMVAEPTAQQFRLAFDAGFRQPLVPAFDILRDDRQ